MNLSDLAAAGSEPKAFFLSISLPRIDENWLEGFSKGLMEEARRFNCPLRGGDTVKSFVRPGQAPYTAISITAMGELPAGKGLTRAGARVGDDVWVSGTPGDAFAALGRSSDTGRLPSRSSGISVPAWICPSRVSRSDPVC